MASISMVSNAASHPAVNPSALRNRHSVLYGGTMTSASQPSAVADDLSALIPSLEPGRELLAGPDCRCLAIFAPILRSAVDDAGDFPVLRG